MRLAAAGMGLAVAGFSRRFIPTLNECLKKRFGRDTGIRVTREFTVAEQESIIEQCMSSSEGRETLSQCFVEPIRRSIEYQSAGRRLMMVDELPKGALGRFEEIAHHSHIIAKRHQGIPDHVVEGEEVLVPTFEVACCPQVNLKDVKGRRYYIADGKHTKREIRQKFFERLRRAANKAA
jgi:hypothetical protein